MSLGPGAIVDRSDPDRFRAGIEAVLRYRGDVTLVTRAGERIEGYVYDAADLDAEDRARVRMLPADGERRRTIAVAELEQIEVTGRDTAEGRSFDAWIKRYVERKRAGLPANIEE